MKYHIELEKALNTGNQNLVSRLIDGMPQTEVKFKLLKMIVRHNADFALKKVIERTNSADQLIGKEGFTILHYAVLNANSDTVALIMEKFPWIVIKQTSSGFNALHFAVRTGNKDTIYVLVENNPELLALTNANDKNPIQLGLQESPVALKYLLKAMTDVNSDRSNIYTKLIEYNVNPKVEKIQSILNKLNITNTTITILESDNTSISTVSVESTNKQFSILDKQKALELIGSIEDDLSDG